MILSDMKQFAFNDHDMCDALLELIITLHKIGLSDFTARMQIPYIFLDSEAPLWTLTLYKETDD